MPTHDKALHKQQEIGKDIQGAFCPKIMKKIAKNAEFVNMCFASPSGQGVFQVQIKDYQHIVDINARTCDCRRWQLTGVMVGRTYERKRRLSSG